jgi:hypothetical protein
LNRPGQADFKGANSFAVSAGASVDFKIADRITYRVINGDCLQMQTEARTYRDRRVSTGIRLSFWK